ncbi:hypothetical protein KPL74_06400 [Bacillus sp. NP157]|nr:hypothetical protein KPL74_06400 [Bacillus sp. NP157]
MSTPLPPSSSPSGSIAPTFGDGGFSDRLSGARHAQDIHGIPGSDLRRAPGIQMVDPRSQGIGAVMRNAQRLFGVTSRHCIDVETWARMSPEELIARHLTSADVEAANQKYQCNRPLGLSF